MVMTPSQVREPTTKSLQFGLLGVSWGTFQKLMRDLSQDCGCQIIYDQDNQLLLISQHSQRQFEKLQIHCTRPLNPPILGDFEDRNSPTLEDFEDQNPPRLGGWGANAGMKGTSQTDSQTEFNRIITLNTLTWETFTDLIVDVEGSRGWRFVYDNGVLEIRMPLQEHEEPKEFLMDFITVLVDELGLEMRKLGSLTLTRKDLNRAIEPDSCCYIQNEALVRGKNSLDLKTLPPPDLAVESDHTNSSLNKFNIYAALGVPELWLYRKQRIEVYLLTEDRYELSDTSLALPLFPIKEAEVLIEQNGKMGQRAIVRLFRAQIQELLKTR
jgi:Uma2 family endonuclease